ncbi:organic cation/carnitine transporter 7-like isoform X2 [Hevea brasiliensis]|uniref:organic cation/carnitine transporter 7-like isoform X2 n=1 Tax=Hevea brasiliensis TaxID=3981 RepID=UPI0025E0CF4B|nr:organic cation/carnitine transporter 7-like isoform X2 [Hevea brasiliensis]
MESERLVYTLDEALAAVGFGKFQGLVLVYAGFGWFSEAIEIMILSFVGPAVKLKWALSSSEESLLSSVVFAGMLIGAYSWGLTSDNYGRRKALLSMTVITSGAGFLSAFSPNYISLLFLRCLVGFGLGGGHVFLSWFLEFIPTLHRGKWMVIISIFWTIGTIFEASLAWIVMPILNWRWLLALSAVPSFSLLLFYRLVPESPRYLCLKGRTVHAHQILEKMALVNQKDLPPGMLISYEIIEVDEEYPSEYTSFLSVAREKISIFRSVLLTSEIRTVQDKCSSTALLTENLQADSLYTDVLITSFAELPGILLSVVIVDRFGRKPAMTIMFILAWVFLLPLVSSQSAILTTGLLFGARMFSMGTFTVACIYAPELYPTSVRSTGAGVASAIGRIGGMVCPLVAVALTSSCHLKEAIILFEVVIAVTVTCILLFPFETSGRELGDSIAVSDSKQALLADNSSSTPSP